MFLTSKNSGPVEGSSEGILHASLMSCPRKKKHETEQHFTLSGSKTDSIHENQSRQGHKKNVLFESHIW